MQVSWQILELGFGVVDEFFKSLGLAVDKSLCGLTWLWPVGFELGDLKVSCWHPCLLAFFRHQKKQSKVRSSKTPLPPVADGICHSGLE